MHCTHRTAAASHSPAPKLVLPLLMLLLGPSALAQAAAPEQKTGPAAAATDAAQVAPAGSEAPKEAGMPEECSKLVGALVACRQTGGWKQTICEKGAKMQYSNCPIPVEKLPL